MLDGSLLNDVYRISNETINPASKIILKSTPVILEEAPPPKHFQEVNQNTQNIKSEIVIKNNELKTNNEGFLDYLIMKKRDMVKIIVLVMTIVVALSLHSFFIYWIKAYLVNFKTSVKRELLIRLLYPLIILLLIWFIKAFLL